MKIKALILSLTLTSVATYASPGVHQNFAGVFIGGTSIDSETYFSYGLEYEYKFTKLWGAGITYEKTNDAHHGDGVDIFLALAYLHPWKDLRIGAGYGKGQVGGKHSYNENIARVSISYDFHIAGIGIAPTIAADFVDGEKATVFGISFIKSF